MTQDITTPGPSVVLDLIESFRRSKTMFAAVSLGVFDALAGGPKLLGDLAAGLKADADTLERLLDACVGLGLRRRDGGGYRQLLVISTPARVVSGDCGTYPAADGKRD